MRVVLEAGITDPSDIRMVHQVLGYLLGALAVAGDPDMEALQAEVEIEGVLRALDRAEIPHQLACGLGDEGRLSKCLGVDQSVVGRVGGAKTGIFISVGVPVEVAAVHQRSSYGHPMTVHVFCG